MMKFAKCKCCNDKLEILEGKMIYCNCGELVLDGMKKKIICKTSVNNYIEIDDEGNEIVSMDTPSSKPDREQLLSMLDEMIKNLEDLPSHVKLGGITHYDLASALLLLSSILRS